MFCKKSTLILSALSRHLARKSKSDGSKPVKSTIAAIQRNKDEKLMFGGILETKKDKKKREKKQKNEGVPLQSIGSNAPDSEAHWLSNLSSKDLKLYRKTLSGRYKEVDKDKVREALRTEVSEETNTEESSQPKLMPSILVKKLTTVPMLALKSESEGISVNPVEVSTFPSVTRILSETMSDSSKAALERWKIKMIAEMGEEGFAVYNREQLSFGSRFHLSVRRYLESMEQEVDYDLDAVWGSVRGVLSQISQVKLLETKVVHPVLKYKGVVDCVASYRNIPSVIEWKVSEKMKPNLSNTYDAPLQVTAYLGALSYVKEYRQSLKNGVVVVAYKDGSPAQVFPLDENLCARHWAQWVQRLQLYWQSAPNVPLSKEAVRN